MATVSVSIPDTLKSKMGAHDDINWSAVARKAFEARLDQAELLHQIANKSKLSAKDAKQLGDAINRAVSQQFVDAAHPSRR